MDAIPDAMLRLLMMNQHTILSMLWKVPFLLFQSLRLCGSTPRFRSLCSLCLCSSILFLTACAPSATEPLPTAIDLSVISTNDAATAAAATAAALDATAARIAQSTRNAPATLPPTWTPSPVPLTSAAESVESSDAGSQPSGLGTIYFLYTDDPAAPDRYSIIALAADGSGQELIPGPVAPADLTLSPDGTLLAFTARGSGSARELFIMRVYDPDLADGDSRFLPIQISCLGFDRLLTPAWSSDSRTLAFAASQSETGALGIYAADVAGADNCPAGNNQRLLAQTDLTIVSSIAWSASGDQVFFSSQVIYGIDVATQTLYPPLTQTLGFGPDFAVAYRPDSDALFYLKTDRDDQTAQTGGVLYSVLTTDLTTLPLPELRLTPLLATSLQWSRDGRYLVAGTLTQVYFQNMLSGTANVLVAGTKFPPAPVFSPDAQAVAYIDSGRELNPVPQVYVIDRETEVSRQLTNSIEGYVINLNWSPY
jgi:hypothetical protein